MLFHVGSGMPARATEMETTIRYVSGARNIMYDGRNEMVSLLSAIAKLGNSTESQDIGLGLMWLSLFEILFWFWERGVCFSSLALGLGRFVHPALRMPLAVDAVTGKFFGFCIYIGYIRWYWCGVTKWQVS